MTSTLTPNKRIILTLGGKGGTGKTLHCRTLFHFLLQSGVNCLAFDADFENPEFFEYYAKNKSTGKFISLLDFSKVSGAKQLFSQVEKERPDVVLVDMPGASGKMTRQQIENFELFSIAAELGYRVTIDTVLNNGYNSITSLRSMLQYCGNRADYVAVKSLAWKIEGMDFSRWEKSSARTDFLLLNGIEIEMPLLHMTAFDALHENAIPFIEADRLEFGDRLLVNSFLNRSLLQLNLASSYFGLPAKPIQTLPASGSPAPTATTPAPSAASSGKRTTTSTAKKSGTSAKKQPVEAVGVAGESL
jgi:hypothetical protein